MHATFIDTVTLARPASDFIWLDEKYRSLSFRFRFIYYANEYDTCTRNRYRKPEKLVPFSDSFLRSLPDETGSKISGLIFLHNCPPIHFKATRPRHYGFEAEAETVDPKAEAARQYINKSHI